MRIATWNIGRPKYKKKIREIIAKCQHIDADILVLTEADDRVQLDGYMPVCATEPPKEYVRSNGKSIHYEETEKRVMIYTKYPVVGEHIKLTIKLQPYALK